MKWVEEKGIMDKEDLEIFAKLKYRGAHFELITRSDLERRLPPGSALGLDIAIQELIRSKDERGQYIYIYLFHAFPLF